MPGFTVVGYIYIYYPDSDGNYIDDNDSDSEELGPNERELVLFVPHPDGVAKESYPVMDYEDIDRRLLELKAEKFKLLSI
jgi:hypothetical protein